VAGSCVAKAKITRLDRVGWRLGSLGWRLSTATKTRQVLGVACTTRAVKVTRSPDESKSKEKIKGFQDKHVVVDDSLCKEIKRRRLCEAEVRISWIKMRSRRLTREIE